MHGSKPRPKLLVAAAAGLLAGVVPGAVGASTEAVLPTPLTSSNCAGPPAWPMVGADLSNTRDASGGPSTSQAGALQVLWRFHATDGDFTGTPVVGGCTVYVGSNGGWVRALHEKDGTVAWQTQVGGPIPSSVALDGGTVFVALGTPGSPSVAALDASSGRVIWKTQIDAQPESDAYGSPIVYNGVVYEGVGGVVTSEVTDSTITVRGALVALDARTGSVLWHTYTVPPGDDGGAIWSSPSVDTATGLLYVGDGNAYHSPAAPTTDSLLAFNSKTGQIVRHFQATGGDVFNASNLTGPDLDFGASPNLLTLPGGVQAVGIGQKSGLYWMFRRSDLTPLWNTRIGLPDAFGGVIGSTAVDGTRVYGPNTLPGLLWALGQQAGQLAWLNPPLDPLHYGPVSVSNGVVYSEDSLGFLDVIDAGTGLPLARMELNPLLGGYYSQAYGGVSIADGQIFADTGSQSATGDVLAIGT